MLSGKAVREFQQIWEEEFGEKISRDYAKQEGTELINLFEIIYRPVPKGGNNER